MPYPVYPNPYARPSYPAYPYFRPWHGVIPPSSGAAAQAASSGSYINTNTGGLYQ